MDRSAIKCGYSQNLRLNVFMLCMQLLGLSARDNVITSRSGSVIEQMKIANFSSSCAVGEISTYGDFEIIQSISGNTVSISSFVYCSDSGGFFFLQVYEVRRDIDIACCYPGYHFDITSATCKIRADHPYLLRADERNKYLYLQVMC